MNDVTTMPRRRPAVNLQALEDEVGEVIRTVRRPEITPIDEATEHAQPDLGRLSADAVLATAEQAAVEVEKLKLMVKELAPELERSMMEMDTSLKTIAEAAKQVRDRGERTRLQVEAANTLAKDIAAKCAEFTKMVSGEG